MKSKISPVSAQVKYSKYLIAFAFSILILLWSFKAERSYHEFWRLESGDPVSIFYYFSVKIFLACISFWLAIEVQKIAIAFLFKTDKMKYYAKFIIWFSLYFAVMMGFFMLTYPGIYRGDEVWMLYDAKTFNFGEQHFFTYFLYELALQVFKQPFAIVPIQIFFISIVVAYITASLQDVLFKGKWLYTAISIIPFFFLPVIDSNLYPLRASLNSMLELAFLMFILITVFKKKKDVDYKLSPGQILMLFVLLTIITLWRSEGIYYLILGPIIIFIAIRKCFCKNSVIIACTAVFVIVNIFTYRLYSNIHSLNFEYKAATMYPFLNTLLADSNAKINEKQYEGLRGVITEDGLKNNGNKFANSIRVGKLNDEKLAGFSKACISLMIDNPKIYARHIMKMLANITGVNADYKDLFVANAQIIFEPIPTVENGGALYDASLYMMPGDINRPINPERRKATIQFLETCDQELNLNPMQKFIWNSAIPFAFLIILATVALLKGKILTLFVSGAAALRLMLSVMTAHTSFFMFGYSTYLIGYYLMFLLLAFWIYNRKHGTKYTLLLNADGK